MQIMNIPDVPLHSGLFPLGFVVYWSDTGWPTITKCNYMFILEQCLSWSFPVSSFFFKFKPHNNSAHPVEYLILKSFTGRSDDDTDANADLNILYEGTLPQTNHPPIFTGTHSDVTDTHSLQSRRDITFPWLTARTRPLIRRRTQINISRLLLLLPLSSASIDMSPITCSLLTLAVCLAPCSWCPYCESQYPLIKVHKMSFIQFNHSHY